MSETLARSLDGDALSPTAAAKALAGAPPKRLGARDATHAGWTLAEGETLLWSGRPAALPLAFGALGLPVVAAYFGVLAAWGVLEMVFGEATAGAAVMPVATGAGTLAVAIATAFLLARTTRYLVTDRRVILRYGAILPRSLSIPLRQVAALAVAAGRAGRGDIALRLRSGNHIPYLKLWPHVRPWRIRHPEPMLRCLPDATLTATRLTRLLAGPTTATTAAVADPLSRCEEASIG